MIVGLASLAAGVAILSLKILDYRLGWLLVLTGGVLAILLTYLFFVQPWLLYQHQPKLKSEYRMRFEDDGILFRTDDIDAELKWTLYHSWQRDDEFYLLHHGKRDQSVIPRRALLGDADHRLAQMLRKQIGPPISEPS